MPDRTDEELRDASDCLIYEYWMLKGLTQLLEDDDRTEIGLLRNALLESFLMHARALVDFLYRPRNHETDAVAGDYLDGSEKTSWKKKHFGDPDWFKDIRTRINKGVAHVTYDRHKDEWDYELIEREIGNALTEFLRLVPVKRLGARWDETKRSMENGGEFLMVLPPFLAKGGITRTSFYYYSPLSHDWYPD